MTTEPPLIAPNGGREIAILAGGGHLPLEIAREIRRTGGSPRIVAISGIADADYHGHAVQWVALGQIGRMLRALRQDDTTEMVIAGYVRRPDLMRLRIDLGFVRHLPTILGLMRGGDDHVMRRIAAFFERQGLTVRGTGDVARALLAPEGVLTGDPTPADWAAARLGQRAIATLAPYDVGQAVIVENGRLAAVEAAEGTDGLLRRLDQTANRRILVKTAKPGQDLRLDLPTVGADTLRCAVAAQVCLTALEADRTLVVDRGEVSAIAAACGVAIVGLPAPSAAATLDGGQAERVGRVDVAPIGGLRADLGSQTDARIGLALIEDLAVFVKCRAVLVARQHVLAVNIDEPMQSFLVRSRRLGQWGDNRRQRRNVTLVMGSAPGLENEDIEALTDGPIAGIAFSTPIGAAQARDQLVQRARHASLYLLERR